MQESTTKSLVRAQAQSRSVAIPSTEDGLRRYIQEINQFPMLAPEEEYELSKRWREKGDTQAAHRLVTSHLRLVVKIASRYKGYGLPHGDLIAEGNVGLMQAVKRFEPEKGFRLSTYAMWWIKAAIQEYILRSWSLVKIGSSAAQKRLFFNLRKLKKKLGVTGMNMTDEVATDIARRLEVSKQDVIDMDQRMMAADVFLNSPAGEEGDAEKMDFLAEPSESHETILAEQQEMKQKRGLLARALAKLNPREQAIIRARRLKDDPETLDELSKQYNISRERVRQIEMRAFEKLQKEMVSSNS